MRIIGGEFRGRRITAPRQGARPSTDRTREAIFNLINARMDLEEARVLDLFAGSGALGFEALSRGAARVTFVESGREAISVIQANAHELGVGDRCEVVRLDAFRYIDRSTALFDLILADPPYDLADVARLPDLVEPLMAPDGLLVLEHGAGVDFEAHPRRETARRYGGTSVSLFWSE